MVRKAHAGRNPNAALEHRCLATAERKVAAVGIGAVVADEDDECVAGRVHGVELPQNVADALIEPLDHCGECLPVPILVRRGTGLRIEISRILNGNVRRSPGQVKKKRPGRSLPEPLDRPAGDQVGHVSVNLDLFSVLK